MGKEIEQIALQRKHEIALKIDENNIASITKEDLQKCDVAIEFSTPASAVSNMTRCFLSGVPVVVGTTGWYDRLEKVKKLCEENDGCLFYASNFSIGVNIFFKMNEELAKIMNNYADYDVSMEEIHHVHKLDATSGTAISLANQVTDNLKRKKKWVNTQTKKTDELEIISKRIDEVPGTHTVKYH